MSGHSKWATTHRQKEITDAKRGAIFTKFANVITIAAKKGGDPETNPSLRSAIDRAKSISMPKDNIERAIKRGTGELLGDQVEELYYEAVVSPNIQVIVKCVTDNRNRSGASVRHIFTKNNGSFASVLWNFEQKGVIKTSKDNLIELNIDLGELELSLIDLGIDDFINNPEELEIQVEVDNFQKVKDFLTDKNIKLDSTEIEYVAKDKINLNDDELSKLDKIFSELEDNEDVVDYYTNLA